MKSALILAVAIVALLSPPWTLAAQDLTFQIVGVWTRTSQVQKDLATGATTDTPAVGSAIFTRAGRFAWMYVNAGRTPPVGPVPTDAERVALFNTSAFGSGTYKIEGGTVFLRYDTSWNENWTGTERRAEMQVLGKVLTWTSPPIKGPDDKDYVAITTMERVE